MWHNPLGPLNTFTSSKHFNLGRWIILMAPRNTIKGVGEKEQRTNEQYGLGLTQVQEGYVMTLCIPCASVDYRWCVVFFAKFPQATRNAESSWLVFPHRSWTISHADWSLLLSVVDSRLPFYVSLRQLFPLAGVPLLTSGRVEISSSGLCLVSR